MLYAAHTLGACLPLCKVSQKSKRGVSRYTESSKYCYKLLRGLKTQLEGGMSQLGIYEHC